MQINSSIKERILKYLDYKGISQYQCYSDTGITRGVLTQKFGLSEDNLLKFLNFYEEVDPTWLVTGKGEMLINNNNNRRINMSNPDAESHLKDVENLKDIGYSEEFVKQLLEDHSKLTDSHQKLADAHYLLTIEVTEMNKERRVERGYLKSIEPSQKVAESRGEYKKKE